MATGSIILLNGATSSGKSTLARLLQSQLHEPFWHYSIDHLRNSGVLPLERLTQLLEPFDVFFVGLHCGLAELERREFARGDRPPGGARQDFETIHKLGRYDLELDSTRAPETNVRETIAAWRLRRAPSAFFQPSA